MTNANDQQAT